MLRNPPWSDIRVRKAASLAIDRQTLAEVHMPGCTGAGSIGAEKYHRADSRNDS